MTRGIIGYGSYVPHWRLDRAEIGHLLGAGGGRGTRSVASYDENPLTMAVEAARRALGDTPAPQRLWFSTPDPAVQDKTNAATLAAGREVAASDFVGSVRSASAAFHAALAGGPETLLAVSDMRHGAPGSTDEREGGDAAVALVVGDGEGAPMLAEFLGAIALTEEFLDRWRRPGADSSNVWEERFGEGIYLNLAREVWARGQEAAHLTSEQVDRVVIAGLHGRSVRAAASALGLSREQLVNGRLDTIGNSGAAHPLLLLADALDTLSPGQVVAVLTLADGADVSFFRATQALESWQRHSTVEQQVASGTGKLSYPRFLTWRGHLVKEGPRRPDPERPAAPPIHQRAAWKFAFTASVCECGQTHLPPSRVCVACRAADRMTPVSYRNRRGTVATHTADRLAFSPSPPVIAAVVDFDGGGRFLTELTDCDADAIGVGDRMEMTFRVLYTAGDVPNYFWKARPVAEEATA